MPTSPARRGCGTRCVSWAARCRGAARGVGHAHLCHALLEVCGPEGRKGWPVRAWVGSGGRGDVMGMRYKLLGRTGLRVSELCLGAMIFGDRRGGWGTSKEEAAHIVERFAEAGGNFVDTANSYAGGESERIVGELTKPERE